MTGTVHFPSMPEAFQFAVDSVSMVKVVWVPVVYEMNGWTNIWLTLLRSSEITTDQSWFISAPMVHGPACFNTTKWVRLRMCLCQATDVFQSGRETRGRDPISVRKDSAS